MLPEAWNVEHNRLHHYHLGEPLDPDLVERNLEFLRVMNIPTPLKYAFALGMSFIWKWYYYAPNTFKELQITERKSRGEPFPAHFDPYASVTIGGMLFPKNEAEVATREVLDPSKFVAKVLAPFLITRFLLLPAPLLLLPSLFGQASTSLYFSHAVVNLVLAELLTNVHAFVTIVTNHAGSDLYKFDDEVKPRSGAFYVRQIVSSANYDAGTDAVDFCHGWLNYQIEHHVWPDLSMLQYQRAAPALRDICRRHGVPYVRENVWTRTRKTLDIMVGTADMKVFPTELEPAQDKTAASGVVPTGSVGRTTGELRP